MKKYYESKLKLTIVLYIMELEGYDSPRKVEKNLGKGTSEENHKRHIKNSLI